MGKPSSVYGWSGGLSSGSPVFAHLWWKIKEKYSWKGHKTQIKKKKIYSSVEDGPWEYKQYPTCGYWRIRQAYVIFLGSLISDFTVHQHRLMIADKSYNVWWKKKAVTKYAGVYITKYNNNLRSALASAHSILGPWSAPCRISGYRKLQIREYSGPSCSKLTRSLVNVPLKLW